ncbi:hypothetical protein [Azotobacter armeniacus]
MQRCLAVPLLQRATLELLWVTPALILFVDLLATAFCFCTKNPASIWLFHTGMACLDYARSATRSLSDFPCEQQE